jgi:hypothetical protein
LAVSVVARQNGDHTLVHVLAGVFLAVSAFFVYRSFYGMQIAKGGTKVSSKYEKSPHIPATRF